MKKGPTFPPVNICLMVEQNKENNPVKSIGWKAIKCSTSPCLKIVIIIPRGCDLENQLNCVGKWTNESKPKYSQESNLRDT